jgi:hypothetical protein
LAAVVFYCVCGVASAQVHTATIEWTEPEAPATLGVPKQPTAEHPYLSTVSVSYDDSTGAIHLAYSFYDASEWAPVAEEAPPSPSVYLGSTCERLGPNGSRELRLDIRSLIQNGVLTRVWTAAQLAGFEGAAEGSFSFDGTTYVGEVASERFIGQRWPCLTVEPETPIRDETESTRLSNYPERVLFHGAVNGGRSRPKNVYLSADGTLEAYGAYWKSWGEPTAIGSAIIEWHGCIPYCAADKPHTGHGEVHLSNLRECHEQLFYSGVSVYVYVRRRLRAAQGASLQLRALRAPRRLVERKIGTKSRES